MEIGSFVPLSKVIMQGKLFQRCTRHVLSLIGNINTRRMSKPDMGSIFHITNQWNILNIGNYYVNYQNLILLPYSEQNEHWCIYSCLQIPPRENWFQYVRIVYVTLSESIKQTKDVIMIKLFLESLKYLNLGLLGVISIPLNVSNILIARH